jgi:hypothetical protein
MIDKQALDRIKVLNQEPLNQAAKALLPPLWVSDADLHAVSLMRWGMDEAGISLPTESSQMAESLLQQIPRMTPDAAMSLLNSPEGEPMIQPQDLTDAKTAAALLLETLVQSQQASAP